MTESAQPTPAVKATAPAAAGSQVTGTTPQHAADDGSDVVKYRVASPFVDHFTFGDKNDQVTIHNDRDTEVAADRVDELVKTARAAGVKIKKVS